MGNKTAVSYVLEKLQEEFPKQFKDMYNSNQFLIEDIFLKAKQIEKEQIIDAVDYGCSDWGSGKDSEKYYNDEYGK